MVECESCSVSTLALVDALVLIDTWWNVNVRDEIIFDLQNRFNRYMVECEFANTCVVLIAV